MAAEKFGVFVDVQNIYYTTREKFGRPFDYRRFWDEISARGEIVLANAYATERQDESQQRFQRALRHIGFEVKLKPYIRRHDGSAKGDWDVGITIDVLQSASALDRVFLLSGDGDFDLLADSVQTACFPFFLNCSVGKNIAISQSAIGTLDILDSICAVK